MKLKTFFYAVGLLTVVAALASCSSPESDGAGMAKRYNKCNSAYLENVQKIEVEFVSDSDFKKFKSRSEAKDAYWVLVKKANDEYDKEMAEISDLMAKGGMEYANDLEKMLKYEGSIKSGLDRDLDRMVKKEMSNKNIPEPVMAAVRTIVPPKPDNAMIIKNLVGHSLSEGTDNGYYSPYWKWMIEDGEISDFQITEVLSDTNDEYMFIAKMRLTSAVGKKMDAEVKVRYILPRDDDWTIEFVLSLGLKIVKTQLYNNCIRIEQCGWDKNNKCVINQCDVSLEVGYRKLAFDDVWYKDSYVVSPHGSYDIYCKELIVEYVERP